MRASTSPLFLGWTIALATLLPAPVPAAGQTAGEGAEEPDNLRQPPGMETAPLGTLGHVESRGDGDTHLLLLPGAGFGWSVWEDFMSRNAERYTMWAVTPPGYDGTPPPPMPASVDVTDRVWSDALLGALVRLIEEEGIDHPVVVGHHLMGDYYAMRLALEHPEAVSGLVVVAGSPSRADYRVEDGERRPATPEERVATVRDNLMPTMRRATREFFVQNQFPRAFLSRSEARAEELYRIQIDNPVSTQVRYALEWATDDLAARLGNLEVPMLVIQPLPWESFDEFIATFEDYLRQSYGEDTDLREALLERYGSWEAFREEQSGLKRWRELPNPPGRMKIEVVDRSAQFVMDDRPRALDRILAGWIDETVEGDGGGGG